MRRCSSAAYLASSEPLHGPANSLVDGLIRFLGLVALVRFPSPGFSFFANAVTRSGCGWCPPLLVLLAASRWFLLLHLAFGAHVPLTNERLRGFVWCRAANTDEHYVQYTSVTTRCHHACQFPTRLIKLFEPIISRTPSNACRMIFSLSPKSVTFHKAQPPPAATRGFSSVAAAAAASAIAATHRRPSLGALVI